MASKLQPSTIGTSLDIQIYLDDLYYLYQSYFNMYHRKSIFAIKYLIPCFTG
ncbi:MAG: hypothetical protein IPN79_08130 [Saprospiraceae bacterium]|nr:hypothetical protein [Saprospiraceae bacterium]